MANIQWSKQSPYTWNCLSNVPFYVFLCYFWKVKSLFILNLSISYFLSRQNYSTEGKEVGIFSKAPDWIPLFLLKIKQNKKSNKTQTAQTWNIMQSLSTFIRMSGPIQKYKNCIDQWLWKYCCLFKRVRAKRGVGKQLW